MKKMTAFASMVGTLLCLYLPAAPAHAQATRTWVSGVGDDANPCSRTAPCKTFAGAISKTAAGGEINCLDPGGFGAVTITKSMTIDCHEVFGSVLVSGTNGINIVSDNTAAPVVRLRNLNVNGITGAGLNGIRITGATTSNTTVVLEDVMVDGFSQRGITDERSGGKLLITNSTIRNAAVSCVNVAPAVSSATKAAIHKVRTFACGGAGLAANNGAQVAITDSVFSDSGVGVDAEGVAVVVVNNSLISGNGTGLISGGGAGLRLSNSDVAHNGVFANGAIGSFGSNRLTNNGAGGSIVQVGGASTENGQQ
jgi:hypothetical protein